MAAIWTDDNGIEQSSKAETNKVVLFIGPNFCDHGVHLLSACSSCNRLWFKREAVQGFLVFFPLSVLLGLILIYYVS